MDNLDRMRALAGVTAVQDSTNVVGTMYEIRDKLNEAYGTGNSFLKYSKVITNAKEAGNLDYLDTILPNQKELTHDEIAELQSAISRKRSQLERGQSNIQEAAHDTCSDCGCDTTNPKDTCDCTHDLDEAKKPDADGDGIPDWADDKDNTELDESAEGRPYVAVHAKKGKTDVSGTSSYGAAQAAAKKWGLKSTAGIDVYLADVTHVATESELNEGITDAKSLGKSAHKDHKRAPTSDPRLMHLMNKDGMRDADSFDQKPYLDAWLAGYDSMVKNESQQMREWANSVYNNFDDRGHVQAQPEGETVDNSLRRYLNAEPTHVKIHEGHTPNTLTSEYKKFLDK
jgi:hypothetical protein